MTAPYYDAFGRGYLLSLETAVSDTQCAVLGVAGADLLVGELASLDTPIQSRSHPTQARSYRAPPWPPPSP